MNKLQSYISFLIVDILIVLLYLWIIKDFTSFNILSFLLLWSVTATILKSYQTSVFEGMYSMLKRTFFLLFIAFSLLTIIKHYELKYGYINNFQIENYGIFSIFILLFRITVILVQRIINTNKKHKISFLLIGEGKLADKLNTFLIKKKSLGLQTLGVINTKNKDANNYLSIKKDLLNDQRFLDATYIFTIQPYINASELNYLNQIIEENNKINKMVLDYNSTFFKKTKYELLDYIPIVSTNLSSFEKHKTAYTKRIFDVIFSSFALVVLLVPLLIFALITFLTSKGPVFFSQERVGKNSKPFNIIKFRSMFIDAEKNGPALASDNDPRITKWGNIMRKYRFDELPQFFLVLIGKMSIVGPRPERKFYIDQVAEKMPQYRKLQQLKPGITSLGQTLYGYAENIEQMRKRARYDLLYINNISLFMDIKIIFLTIKVVITGKGK